MTALTPDIAAAWRTAARTVVAAGLPPDLEHRAEMVTVAGAYAAAQAAAYASETEMQRVLAFELLAGDALTAYGSLSRVELQTVELVVARAWRTIAVEVGRLRGLGEAA